MNNARGPPPDSIKQTKKKCPVQQYTRAIIVYDAFAHYTPSSPPLWFRAPLGRTAFVTRRPLRRACTASPSIIGYKSAVRSLVSGPVNGRTETPAPLCRGQTPGCTTRNLLDQNDYVSISPDDEARRRFRRKFRSDRLGLLNLRIRLSTTVIHATKYLRT